MSGGNRSLCPHCKKRVWQKVVDSRARARESIVRRRRQCSACNVRYTTYELVAKRLPPNPCIVSRLDEGPIERISQCLEALRRAMEDRLL